MENMQQTEIVRKALDGEIYNENCARNLSQLVSERANNAPPEPIRSVVQRVYPEIVPTTKFSKTKAFVPLLVAVVIVLLVAGLAVLTQNAYLVVSVLYVPVLPVLAIAWIPYYYFIGWSKQKKKEIENIRNSIEYQNQCVFADREFDKQQENMDNFFQKQMGEYPNKLANWIKQQDEKIAVARKKLAEGQAELTKHYKTTKTVPLQYRVIEVLKYIYDMISTSEYDFKEAINMYEKSELKKLNVAKVYEQQQANQLEHKRNGLIEEQNEILHKMRTDAKLAARVRMMQHRKTNKILKETTEAIKER